MPHPDPVPSPQVDWSQKIRQGDERAFRELFDLYYEPLCRYAVTLTGETDTGEDVVQALFVWIWEHRQEWQVRGSLRGYLYRAVRSRVISRWRAARVREAHASQVQADLSAEGSGVAADTGNLPDHVTQYAELQVAYWQAIAALPPRGRQAFELHREHGLSCAEVAEVMGISPRTVETHIGRALLALRHALAPYLVAALVVLSR